MRDTRNLPLSLTLHSSESSLVYRKIRTQIHTSEYAINVPIDIIFINCCRSKRLDKIAKHANCLSLIYFILLILYYHIMSNMLWHYRFRKWTKNVDVIHTVSDLFIQMMMILFNYCLYEATKLYFNKISKIKILKFVWKKKIQSSFLFKCKFSKVATKLITLTE